MPPKKKPKKDEGKSVEESDVESASLGGNDSCIDDNKQREPPVLVVFNDDSMLIHESGESDANIKWQKDGIIKQIVYGENIEELQTVMKVMTKNQNVAVINVASSVMAKLTHQESVLIKFKDSSAMYYPLGREHAESIFKDQWCLPASFETGKEEILKKLEKVYNEAMPQNCVAFRVKREILKLP